MSTTHPLAGTNLAVLVGVLSRDAEARTLPSGDRLVALELTIRPSDGTATNSCNHESRIFIP